MTEDEAKTKWCPHVRQDWFGESSTGLNRELDGQLIGTCIGSACMSWRWTRTPEQARLVQQNDWGLPEDHIATGFCGLAGKP